MTHSQETCTKNQIRRTVHIILLMCHYSHDCLGLFQVVLVLVHHRLNGSSSPVLTATSLSYGKAQNSTPHRIKTPDLIEIKFGAVDYVGEVTPHTIFHVNPSKGGFLANG